MGYQRWDAAVGQVLAGSRSSSLIGYLWDSYLEARRWSQDRLLWRSGQCCGFVKSRHDHRGLLFLSDPSSSPSGLPWSKCWRNCVSNRTAQPAASARPALGKSEAQPPVPGARKSSCRRLLFSQAPLGPKAGDVSYTPRTSPFPSSISRGWFRECRL